MVNSRDGSVSSDTEDSRKSPSGQSVLNEENESDADDTQSSAGRVILKPAAVQDAPVSCSSAASEDVELWLMRVPKHSVLRSDFVGKEIVIRPSGNLESHNGVVRGNYVFSDAKLSENASQMHPLLAAESSHGTLFKIGPAFTREVDVTFRPQVEPVGVTAPPRIYPSAPQNLSVKYKPIGPQALVNTMEAAQSGPALHTPNRYAIVSEEPKVAVVAGRPNESERNMKTPGSVSSGGIEKKKKKKSKKRNPDSAQTLPVSTK